MCSCLSPSFIGNIPQRQSKDKRGIPNVCFPVCLEWTDAYYQTLWFADTNLHLLLLLSFECLLFFIFSIVGILFQPIVLNLPPVWSHPNYQYLQPALQSHPKRIFLSKSGKKKAKPKTCRKMLTVMLLTNSSNNILNM